MGTTRIRAKPDAIALPHSTREKPRPAGKRECRDRPKRRLTSRCRSKRGSQVASRWGCPAFHHPTNVRPAGSGFKWSGTLRRQRHENRLLRHDNQNPRYRQTLIYVLIHHCQCPTTHSRRGFPRRVLPSSKPPRWDVNRFGYSRHITCHIRPGNKIEPHEAGQPSRQPILSTTGFLPGDTYSFIHPNRGEARRAPPYTNRRIPGSVQISPIKCRKTQSGEAGNRKAGKTRSLPTCRRIRVGVGIPAHGRAQALHKPMQMYSNGPLRWLASLRRLSPSERHHQR